MVKIESFPEEYLRIFYESLRKISPVNVLMKIANPEELPAGLPENVVTSSWLSQIKVLSNYILNVLLKIFIGNEIIFFLFLQKIFLSFLYW